MKADGGWDSTGILSMGADIQEKKTILTFVSSISGLKGSASWRKTETTMGEVTERPD